MARKKRIIITFASVPFNRGGAELLVENLQQQLTKRQFSCEIVSIPFKWYPREQILKNAFAWRLLDLSESNGETIDMVIATKFPSYWVKHNHKVTWLIHQFRQIYDLTGTPYSDFSPSIKQDRIVMDEIKQTDNKTLSESRKIYTIAQNTTNRLQNYNNIKAETLYHPPKLLGRYFKGETGDYILSVGRLDSLKRIDLLINSFSFINSNLKCIIAGTGPDEDKLKSLIHQRGLETKIKLTGFVNDDELIDLYANCLSVFYAPFDEDYGYVTLEAFFSMKPVITTNDAGGVLEFVVDKKNGLICQPEPQQLAEAMEHLYVHKSLCNEFGASGFDSVKNISWNHVIDKLTDTL